MIDLLIYTVNCAKDRNFNVLQMGHGKIESFLVNETRKILSDFEIQTDQIISAR